MLGEAVVMARTELCCRNVKLLGYIYVIDDRVYLGSRGFQSSSSSRQEHDIYNREENRKEVGGGGKGGISSQKFVSRGLNV